MVNVANMSCCYLPLRKLECPLFLSIQVSLLSFCSESYLRMSPFYEHSSQPLLNDNVSMKPVKLICLYSHVITSNTSPRLFTFIKSDQGTRPDQAGWLDSH